MNETACASVPWRRQPRVDAFNWIAIEGLSILVFLLVLLRVAYMPNADVGTIFAVFVYVWRLMEKLDMMPQIVQQPMRSRTSVAVSRPGPRSRRSVRRSVATRATRAGRCPNRS